MKSQKNTLSCETLADAQKQADAPDSVLKNRVRELRVGLDLRQEDLARETDLTRQTILAIEKGRINPSITAALKIARILREPVDYVFYLDHNRDKGEPLGQNPEFASTIVG